MPSLRFASAVLLFLPVSALAVEPFDQAARGAPSADAAPDFVLDLPVSVDGQYRRDLAVGVSMEGRVWFQSGALRDLLATLAQDGFVEEIALLDDESLVSAAALLERGLAVTYDPASLSVDIELPPAMRRTQRIAVRPFSDAPSDGQLEPADIAVGFVLDLRPRYVHEGPNEGLAPLEGRLDAVANLGGFGGWNLIASADLLEGAKHPAVVTDAAIFKDDFERAVRFLAGTLRPVSPSRLQTSPDLVGVGVFRDYAAIQPFANLRPNGATSFTLERESLVTVEVNGGAVLTERLPAGSYDLSDLPLITGGNDVRVLIEDGLARREVAVLGAYVDVDLLAQGRSRFALAAGGLRRRGGAFPETSGETVLVAQYDRGLTSQLTLGAAGLAVDEDWQVSARAALGTPIGVFAVEGALQDRAARAGAAQARYSWQSNPTAPTSHRIDAQFGIAEAGFGPLAQLSFGPVRSEPRRVDANLLYTLRSGAWNFTAAGQWSERGKVETAAASLGVSVALREVTFGLTARYEQVSDPVFGSSHEEAVLFSVSQRLGDRLRGRVTYDSDERTTQAQILRIGQQGVGEWSGRLLATDDSVSESVDAAVSLITNRAELGLEHRSSRRRGFVSSETSGRVAVGVGIADGRVAAGRPFGAGFAVIDLHESLKGRELTVVRPGGEVAARTGRLGPALHPLRVAYRTETMMLEVEELPVGYDMGPPEVEAFPGAVAGYVYTVGSGASATVMGTLVGADGEPVALAIGALVARDGSGDPAAFFTNRTGRFVAEGLRPGQYDVTLAPEGRVVAVIEVEEGEEGLVRLGELRLAEE
ncbi:fimbrial biogenesis outer membrane usher protein [Parvularcula dongshanensis]|uniref:Outer membrane usher protein n=1 Tax=Parvularcula dongshanensis TaxID=1173995 RepID=A0A840I287_9PROT|nr:fimbrial biogenesis outer membrane usher protein [Parvularcula dongshanensis]MBB4658929.1 outer membrane usher protein [Parvularcula dongshanensis]